MLNYVRFNDFTKLLDAARLNDEDVSKGSGTVRDIASMVNNFTGRGELGNNDRYASIQPIANNLFFSPRKMMATLQMFNPVNYLDPRISPTARLGALKQISGSIIATGVILEMAHLAGASVSTNPNDTNFGKAKFGNTTFDPTGGNAIYLRLLSRLISGKVTSSTGKTTVLGQGYKPQTRASVLESYLRDKLSPTASAIADLLVGTDAVGQKVTAKSELYQKMVPIVMQDFINLIQNDPQNGRAWLGSLSAILGVSMESPKQK